MVCVVSRRFRRKCTTLTVAKVSSVQRDRSTFCSFVQHHLELRTSKIYSKRQNLVQNKNIDVQNLENIGSFLWCFSLGLFPGLCDFFWNCLDSAKGSPLCFFFDILQHNGCQKIPKRPPFYILWHCDTVLKSHLGIFSEFFKNPPRFPFTVFHILQPTGVSQSPLFTILSPGYSADFGRSRLV